ncbi:hypothetical protein WICPIJ_000887 [Wickerhamomyces pijperi]|uniref:Uncharacterized protein n=1 Tax=Wickerhamomyces pijperi TaxID=599730 RepID=A0A9P8TRY2_WICPI|nr:hypothetical protein WICPIJ_000887 [Wickerhamomyces pijperi]
MAKDNRKSPRAQRNSPPNAKPSSSLNATNFLSTVSTATPTVSAYDASTHSITTLLSLTSSNSNANESVNESVMTSPLNQIQSKSTSNAVKTTHTQSRSQFHSIDSKIQETLHLKSEELTKLVLSISAEVNKEPVEDQAVLSLNEGPVFDWEKVLAASQSVFDEYSNEMAFVLKELEELNKQLIIWQESTFILDSEVLDAKINQLESWIQLKELYLTSKKSELNNSAELINDALKNLGNTGGSD